MKHTAQLFRLVFTIGFLVGLVTPFFDDEVMYKKIYAEYFRNQEQASALTQGNDTTVASPTTTTPASSPNITATTPSNDNTTTTSPAAQTTTSIGNLTTTPNGNTTTITQGPTTTSSGNATTTPAGNGTTTQGTTTMTPTPGNITTTSGGNNTTASLTPTPGNITTPAGNTTSTGPSTQTTTTPENNATTTTTQAANTTTASSTSSTTTVTPNNATTTTGPTTVPVTTMSTTPAPPPRPSCADFKTAGYNQSGVYPLQFIFNGQTYSFNAYCDMVTDGGGWTLLQRRMDDLTFTRSWADYKKGFGDLEQSHWLGNDYMHVLTTVGPAVQLRVDLWDCHMRLSSAVYDTFKVGDENSSYALNVSVNATGNAGNALNDDSQNFNQNGMAFTTLDKDNDRLNGLNCANFYKGGWWFNACGKSNLNGAFYKRCYYMGLFQDGIYWGTWKTEQYSALQAEMKIRPAGFNPSESYPEYF